MTLDYQHVRRVCSEGQRRVQDARSVVNQVNNQVLSMGSGFTHDPSFRREYSNFSSIIREAERSLDRLKSALSDIERKAR